MKKILLCIFSLMILVSCKSNQKKDMVQRPLDTNMKMEKEVKRLEKISKDEKSKEWTNLIAKENKKRYAEVDELCSEYFNQLLLKGKVSPRQYNEYLEIVLNVLRNNKGVELSHVLKYINVQILEN